MDTLGKRMRFAREAKGLSLEKVGAACGGKTVQAVRKWETDKATPNPHDLWTIVGLTGINPGWLITGTGRRYGSGQDDKESRGRVVPSIPWQEVPAYLTDDEYKPPFYMRTTLPCGPRSFAVIIEDRANDPLIPIGATAIFDPDRLPKPGEFVLALIDGKPVVRKFRERGDHIELAPHKGDYKEFRANTDLTQWLIGTLSEISHDVPPT